MPTRTLEIDLRQGTGAESEPMYGVVTVQRAKAKTTGGFEILPFETSLKLINGKATITEAETDGTGPFYDSVYLFRVQNGYCGHRYGFMAALPDGTTPITTGELPMVDPITGEGIYMDVQEWNERFGDLPNKVESLEGRVETLEDVAGLTPESPIDAQTANLIEDTASLTNAALSAAIDDGMEVVSLAFVGGATGAENLALLQAAVNLAQTNGKALFLKGTTFGQAAPVAGTVNVTSTVRIYGTARDRTILRQAVKPKPIFYVTGEDVTFEDMTFKGDGLDMTGHPVFGENTFQNYVGVKAHPDAHRLAMRRIGAKDIYCALLVRDVTTTISTPPKMQGLIAEDFLVTGVWSALHGGPFLDARITGIRGSYRKAFGSGVDTGQKPHLIYLGVNYIAENAPLGIWDPAWRSVGVKITDCQAWDAPDTGAAYALKHVDGLDAANLSARNCPGGVELYGAADSELRNVASVEDTYPATGEESSRAGTTMAHCKRVVMDGVLVSHKAMDNHGKALYMESTSEDCTYRNPTVVTRRTVDMLAAGDTEIVLSGTRNRVENPTIRNLGGKATSAIRVVGTGSNGQVINPRVVGSYTNAVKCETNHAGAVVDYDPYQIAVSGGLSTGTTTIIRDRSATAPAGFVADFVAADGTALALTDDGRPWIFVGTAGSNLWSVTGNAARYSGTAGRGLAIVDARKADGTLTSTIGDIGSAVGALTARVQDADNHIGVRYRTTAGVNRLQLYIRINGSLTELGVSPVDKLTAGGSVVELVLIGSGVSVKLNGIEVIAPVTEPRFATLTRHGMEGQPAGADLTIDRISFV